MPTRIGFCLVSGLGKEPDRSEQIDEIAGIAA
jgi:hypothetical protein